MRASAGLLLVLATAACQPAVPASGVGFEDYSTYLHRREAELAGTGGGVTPMASAPVVPTQPQFSTEVIGSAIDAADAGTAATPLPGAGATFGSAAAPGYSAPGALPPADPSLAGSRPRGNAPMGIREETGEMAGAHTGISDENDFNAVSARRTIQSDAELMAQNRANYTVIAPQPVPQRAGGDGPNIVGFALSTSHMPGTKMYKRSALQLKDPASACAKFASPDLAQQAFLSVGGPDRDRKGLDPDGDGFACGWDPRPFRAVR
ncbi:hypothetical protein [Cereibacter sphaeroides]|uniref:hypothetical protein n=1 Tax=Cereibacter sphaeroides TaxID=1063 RepID=UPI001F305927|nr:hypothetical protein [Cereibacter sphaeroides]MCE6970347.1 hypothetical protein [Cereibacter sphaeroides]